jgi:glycyl-tRNA synthetase beta chain
MPTKDFLFELGVEEIPAGYIAATVKKIEEHFKKGLTEQKISFSNLKTFTTPRRFAIRINELQTKQNDEIIERVGPAKAAAFDADGNLTKAALGFLRGAKANPEDIFFVDSPKGEKIAIKKEIPGQETSEILKKLIIEFIGNISFPKSMKWGSNSLNFARPIRWLLVLYGDEIIPLEFQGIQSGNISFGNRFQKLDNLISINNIEEYEERLESVFVIADRAKRKLMIQKQIEDLFVNSQEQIVPDENLLEIVTDLVENPTVVIADFSDKYLLLPQKVITSTLSQHQKYFAVKDGENKITNKFVFVSNGDEKYSDLIKIGNEKVITARLEDAGFFYKEDTSVSLESFVADLAEVTFQEQLGTLLNKTERLEKIVSYISSEISAQTEIEIAAQRAALLCKADLVTLMLGEKEFTKLQGYMGREYALISGEKPEVADAIYEHYLPRGERDELPVSIAGAIVAIADKLDTVCGIIGVNMIPTGSKDPFALRRAANGIVQIIDQFHFEINLQKLITNAFEILENKLPEPNNNLEFVLDFFQQRVVWLLKQKGIEYDVIESVKHIDYGNIPDLVHRAEALQNFKNREDFMKLVLGFKRVSNIIKDFKDVSDVKMTLLSEGSEKILQEGYSELNSIIKDLLISKSYELILEKLVEYGKTIDRFFDDVLVNVEDESIRLNRHNLLFQIRELFLKVADISKIVIENEK